MEDLDEDPAGRDEHERPELRVADDAERDLDAGRSHRCHDDLRTEAGGDVLVGGPERVRIGETERHPADVGLVLHAGRHRLHRDRPADLVRGGDRAVDARRRTHPVTGTP